MDQWEYKSMLIDGAQLEGHLNALGREGWECISVVAVHWSGSGRLNVAGQIVQQFRVLLKRRV